MQGAGEKQRKDSNELGENFCFLRNSLGFLAHGQKSGTNSILRRWSHSLTNPAIGDDANLGPFEGTSGIAGWTALGRWKRRF
jgi:hypothetical protein